MQPRAAARLAEHLHADEEHGGIAAGYRAAQGLPIAIVRPSIVETSTDLPFAGWNEGINTSAPLSYLLGTYFRQLPTNERKCLDVIPVDMVCRGMTLIAAALIQRGGTSASINWRRPRAIPATWAARSS